MRSKFAQLAACLLCLGLACAVPQLLAKKKDQPADTGANEQKRAVHALNRLAFGPRPGDVQQVVAMGVDRWIDLQLHPDKIQDDAMDSRLAPLRTLHMSAKEIVEEFPDNHGEASVGWQEVSAFRSGSASHLSSADGAAAGKTRRETAETKRGHARCRSTRRHARRAGSFERRKDCRRTRRCGRRPVLMLLRHLTIP